MVREIGGNVDEGMGELMEEVIEKVIIWIMDGIMVEIKNVVMKGVMVEIMDGIIGKIMDVMMAGIIIQSFLHPCSSTVEQ